MNNRQYQGRIKQPDPVRNAYYARSREISTNQWYSHNCNIQVYPTIQTQPAYNNSMDNTFDLMIPTHSPNNNHHHMHIEEELRRKSQKIANILNGNAKKKRSEQRSVYNSRAPSKPEVKKGTIFSPNSVQQINSNINRHMQLKLDTDPILLSRVLRVIPDQTNKHYLSIELPAHWMNPRLAPDLLDHIRVHTKRDVSDIYIEKADRLGYITVKSKEIAEKFLKQAKDGHVKCWGRTIAAVSVECRDPKPTWKRIRVKTVNFAMSSNEFEEWCYWILGCTKQKNLLADIQVVFPKKTIKNRKLQKSQSQVIIVFDKAEDAVDVAVKLQQVGFRGYPLNFKHWEHPNAPVNGQQSEQIMRQHKPIDQASGQQKEQCKTIPNPFISDKKLFAYYFADMSMNQEV